MEEVVEDLIYYVRTNDIEEIKKILKTENINSINNIKDENDNTLLHFACANNIVDLILFFLYECSIDYNKPNGNGNTPLLWAIQNKNIEAIKQVLLFDYLLKKNDYINIEKKKNEIYENIKNEMITKKVFFNKTYTLSDNIKKKINSLNLVNILLSDNNNNVQKNGTSIDEGVENGQTNTNKQLYEYKERNKIDILKKNAFGKNILSEAFNVQDENILQLILSHPISSVLDHYESTSNNDQNFKVTYKNRNDGEKKEGEREEGEREEGEREENTFTKLNNKPEQNLKKMNGYTTNGVLKNHAYEEYEKTEVSMNNICMKYLNSCTGNVIDKPCVGNIVNEPCTINTDKKFTDHMKDAQIIQEYTYDLMINNKKKIQDKEIIIRIREIGINYIGNSLGENNAYEDVTGINIWESSIIASKWISDFCIENNFFFNNKNCLEIGAGCGLVSLSLFMYANFLCKNSNNNSGSGDGDCSVSEGHYKTNQGIKNLIISDVNPFTLNNILFNVEMNRELLNNIDFEWEKKIKICNINWNDKNSYPTVGDEIITYDCIIGSDLIYNKNNVQSIMYLLNLLLKKNGVFFYVFKKNRDGIQLFLETLQNNNFIIQTFTPPDSYFINPFINLSQDLFHLKFSEFEERSNFIMIICERS
ncbi:methyltransferase, putative [Hepatocystis sp. ex Piliocolobus tephrosceles]|nr:methyltransferase, putative [Hepatocystis sp. ex Piliocolobus tephrosceles]